MAVETPIGPVGLTRAVGLLAERGDAIRISTLSRYVRKYADALDPQSQGKKTVVDFETLIEHRAQNVNRNSTGAPNSKTSSDARGRAGEAALNIRAQRMMRELELAERMKTVTPTREVEEASIAAVEALKNAFALALNDTAATMAAALDVEPRLLRPHLRAFERLGLEAFVRALEKAGSALR